MTQAETVANYLSKHGTAVRANTKDFDPVQLTAGTLVELEHGYDFEVAKQIAMDHLTEDPEYYSDDLFQEDIDERLESLKNPSEESDLEKLESSKAFYKKLSNGKYLSNSLGLVKIRSSEDNESDSYEDGIYLADEDESNQPIKVSSDTAQSLLNDDTPELELLMEELFSDTPVVVVLADGSSIANVLGLGATLSEDEFCRTGECSEVDVSNLDPDCLYKYNPTDLQPIQTVDEPWLHSHIHNAVKVKRGSFQQRFTSALKKMLKSGARAYLKSGAILSSDSEGKPILYGTDGAVDQLDFNFLDNIAIEVEEVELPSEDKSVYFACNVTGFSQDPTPVENSIKRRYETLLTLTSSAEKYLASSISGNIDPYSYSAYADVFEGTLDNLNPYSSYDEYHIKFSNPYGFYSELTYEDVGSGYLISEIYDGMGIFPDGLESNDFLSKEQFKKVLQVQALRDNSWYKKGIASSLDNSFTDSARKLENEASNLTEETSFQCKDSQGEFEITVIPEDNIITVSRGEYPQNEVNYDQYPAKAIEYWASEGLIDKRFTYQRVGNRTGQRFIQAIRDKFSSN